MKSARGDNFGKTLHMDHNHSTNKARGFLCHKCNSAVGLLNDDPNLFKLAAKYLKKYEKKEE